MLPLTARVDARQGQAVPPPVVIGAPAQTPAPQTPAPATPTVPGTPAPGTPAAPVVPPKPPPPPPPYAVRWTQPIDITAATSLVATASAIVLGGNGTPLAARAMQDGHELWKSDLVPTGRIVASGTLVFVPVDGGVRAVDAATGTVRWTLQAPAPLSLTADAGRLIVAAGRTLRAVALADGTPAWQRDLPGDVRAGPAADTALGAVALADGSILAFDPATGQDAWRVAADITATSMAVTSRLVLIGTVDGNACGLQTLRGAVAWCYPVRVPVIGSAAADQRFYYFAFLDNTVRALSPRGDLQRRTNLAARPADGPALVGPHLLVPLATGEITVLNAADGKVVLRLGQSAEQQTLEAVGISPPDKLIATLTVSPGSTRTLTLFAPPPPPPAAPAPGRSGGAPGIGPR
jgi:hypothetical protein